MTFLTCLHCPASRFRVDPLDGQHPSILYGDGKGLDSKSFLPWNMAVEVWNSLKVVRNSVLFLIPLIFHAHCTVNLRHMPGGIVGKCSLLALLQHHFCVLLTATPLSNHNKAGMSCSVSLQNLEAHTSSVYWLVPTQWPKGSHLVTLFA